MTLMVVDGDTGRVVAARLRLALNPWTRLRGLIGTPPLEPDEGLLIRPCNGVHTFFVARPLDLVYLARDGRVEALVAGLRPWRIGPLLAGVRAVLELREGRIRESGVEEGHVLHLVRAVRGGPRPGRGV